MKITILDKTNSPKISKGIKYKFVKGIIDIAEINENEITLILDWIPSKMYLKSVYVDEFSDNFDHKFLKCDINAELFNKYIVFDNSSGYYRFKCFIYNMNKALSTRLTGTFPYSFPKYYAAQTLMDMFKTNTNLDNIKMDDVDQDLSAKLKYTFGLEFETSCGVIPEDRCFADGLIPLRDGSITGNEYSTIVLDSTNGLSMIKQQLLDLREYTFFNKECSLHIHMGGFPAKSLEISILYLLCRGLENTYYDYLLPRYSFSTDRYKSSGKSYCQQQPIFNSFNDLYTYFTEMPFFGSFTSSHPKDPDRTAKWKVEERYFALNLINMLCYAGPKTVEFRFLRPTFNYRKIRFWIAVFNAILKLAEQLASTHNQPSCISDCADPLMTAGKILKDNNLVGANLCFILKLIYGTTSPLAIQLNADYKVLSSLISIQDSTGDYTGSDIYVENKIMKDIL